MSLYIFSELEQSIVMGLFMCSFELFRDITVWDLMTIFQATKATRIKLYLLMHLVEVLIEYIMSTGQYKVFGYEDSSP